MRLFTSSISIKEQPNVTVNNLDPDAVSSIEYDGVVSLITLGANILADSDFMRNSILSVASGVYGSFEFVVAAIVRRAYTFQNFGLYIDDFNRIELYRSPSFPYNVNYRIVSNNATVYSLTNLFFDWSIIKIEVTPTTVTLYLWGGNDWVKNGVDFNIAMPQTKNVFAATTGGSTAKVSINDIVIT